MPWRILLEIKHIPFRIALAISSSVSLRKQPDQAYIPLGWTCPNWNFPSLNSIQNSTYHIRVCPSDVDRPKFSMYTCYRRRVKNSRCMSRYHPITTGGFVKSEPIVFESVSGSTGLTLRHRIAGTPAKRFIPEAKGSKERANDSMAST